MMNKNNEIGWYDAFEVDEGQFTKLEGRYYFTVINLRNDRFEGSDKCPACNRLYVEIAINNPADGNEYTWEESFLMTPKCIWKLAEFFISIGQHQDCGKILPDWKIVKGATGICECKPREYEGKLYNNVVRWIPPQEQTPPTDVTAAFNPPQAKPSLNDVPWN